MRVQRQEKHENNLRIIFVGRLTPEKGADLLPRVDQELQKEGVPCKWTVVAPHTTDAYDEWLHMPQVDYREYIPNSKMPAEYAKQDVLLLPSHAEGFPLSVLEAMKSGVVPVVTNLETLSEGLIKNGDTGFLFERNDVTAIANRLKGLYRDGSLLQRIGQNAMNHAGSLYSEAAFRKKWAALLERDRSAQHLNKPMTLIYDRLDVPWLSNTATRAIRKWRAGRKGKS
jgi:glycosyltransferase involved in cell wall biosynthesis